MEIDATIENRIWKEGILSQDQVALCEIMQYLAERFRLYIGRPVEVCESNVEQGVGGSCSVFVKSAQSSPIDVEWECLILMRLPEDYEEKRTQIYANLLAFAGGKRIGLHDHQGQSVLYVRYLPDASGHGMWGDAKWYLDEYGEWEAYQTPSWTENSI